MKKKIIIVTMILMIVIMSVGYSIYGNSITINGTANIASSWNILFTKIEEVDKKGSVTELTPPSVSGTIATFNVDFKLPGDKIVYQITVENKGTIDAVVKEIKASETGSDGVYFKIDGIKKGDKLPSKGSQIITVEIGYSSEVTSQPGDLKNNLTLSATFEQDGGGNIPSEDLNIEGPVLTQVTGGSNITLNNSSGRSLNNYIIYGNSIQNGIPTPDNPLSIQSLGDNGKITIKRFNNLFNNGYGELGNNNNFSRFGYSKDVPNNEISGSFTISGDYVELESDDYIEVDPTKSYDYSMYVKNVGNSGATFYIGLAEYDVDKLIITSNPYMYIPDTLTTLTQDLKNGDREVHLDNISNFNAAQSTPIYQLGFIFWNYQDSRGYHYPELTYSRNVWTNLYTFDKVDKATNTITLKEPWNHGTIPKGTKLSQSNEGGTYNYSILFDSTIPSTWTQYSATISGINTTGKSSNSQFRPGTKYVRLHFIFNYYSLSNASIEMAGVRLVESSNKDDITIDLTGHEPLRKVGDVADYIDFANKRIVRYIETIEFDGSEEWFDWPPQHTSKTIGVWYRNYDVLGMYQHPTFQNHIGMSTHFVNSTTDSFVINDTLRLYVDSGSSPPYISFRIPYLTISEWKNYLKEQKNKGTPVTVHYALINPIYESIKLPNIGTGVGTNNFTIESNIPPSSVKLFYYKNR